MENTFRWITDSAVVKVRTNSNNSYFMFGRLSLSWNMLDKDSYNALMSNQREITEMLAEEEYGTLKIDVNDNVKLHIGVLTGHVDIYKYISDVSGKRRSASFSMNAEEWRALSGYSEGDAEPQVRRITPELVHLKLYRWVYKCNGELMKISPRWFYYKSICERDAVKRKPLVSDCECGQKFPHELLLAIEEKSVPFPHSYMFQYMCYLYLLEKEISALALKNCFGCQNDSPGQRSHMSYGCLAEWTDVVQYYLSMGMDRVTTKHVEELLYKCYAYLDVNVPMQYWVFQTCLANMLP